MNKLWKIRPHKYRLLEAAIGFKPKQIIKRGGDATKLVELFGGVGGVLRFGQPAAPSPPKA